MVMGWSDCIVQAHYRIFKVKKRREKLHGSAGRTHVQLSSPTRFFAIGAIIRGCRCLRWAQFSSGGSSKPSSSMSCLRVCARWSRDADSADRLFAGRPQPTGGSGTNPQLFPSYRKLKNCYSAARRTSNQKVAMYAKAKTQNKIMFYRRRMGFTQRHVARLLRHADASMVSRYERGASLPPLETALGLELALRVPVAFLFPSLYEQLRSRIRGEEEMLAGRGQRPLF